MKTNREKAKELLRKANKVTCPHCGDVWFSVFDRIYIQEFGKCFECDDRPESEKQKTVDAIIAIIESL